MDGQQAQNCELHLLKKKRQRANTNCAFVLESIEYTTVVGSDINHIKIQTTLSGELLINDSGHVLFDDDQGHTRDHVFFLNNLLFDSSC